MPPPALRAALVRIAPFAVLVALPALGGLADGPDARWLHAAAPLVAGALLLWWRAEYGELSRQTLPTAREAALGAAAGLAVSVPWVALDAPWTVIDTALTTSFPLAGAGRTGGAAAALQALGAVLVVPVAQELFWRSFLMRWMHAVPFTGVEPHRVGARAMVLATFVFALVHAQWLAAAVTGLAYAWLYRRTGRLWVAVIAHAATGAALGAWVVATGGPA